MKVKRSRGLSKGMIPSGVPKELENERIVRTLGTAAGLWVVVETDSEFPPFCGTQAGHLFLNKQG